MSKETGLKHKYHVTRVDGDVVGFAFVLEPSRDRNAVLALAYYRSLVYEEGYFELARDLSDVLEPYKL